MRGLIIKDFIMLKSMALSCLILTIVWSLVGIFTGFGPAMIGICILITAPSLALYDEQTKFNNIIKTLPVGSKDIVTARYVSLALIVLFFSIYSYIIIFVYSFFSDDTINHLIYSTATLFVCAMLSIIIIPLQYKFGTQKAKVIVLVIVTIIGALALALYLYGLVSAILVINNAIVFIGASVFVIVLSFVLSYMLSLKLYCKT